MVFSLPCRLAVWPSGRLAVSLSRPTSDFRLPTRPLRQRREAGTDAALTGGDEALGFVAECGDCCCRPGERGTPLGVLDQSPLHRLGGGQRHHDRLVTGLDRLLADVVGEELAAGEEIDRPDAGLVAAGRPLQAQRSQPGAPGLDQTGRVDGSRSLALRRAW